MPRPPGSDGFAATTDLTEALTWAAERDALIVLAVPMPAVARCSATSRNSPADCPLTDVISVKGAVLEEVRGGRICSTATSAATRWPAPRTPGWRPATPRLFIGAPWVISVDEHVDAASLVAR